MPWWIPSWARWVIPSSTRWRGPTGASSPAIRMHRSIRKARALPGGEPVFFDASYYEAPVRVVLLREFIADPEFDGWTTVQVWQTVTQRHALSLQLLVEAGAVLLFVVLGGVAMVWFGIIRGLRPLTDLREAVLLRSPDELRPIRRPVPREVGAAGGGDERPVQAARGRHSSAGTPSSRMRPINYAIPSPRSRPRPRRQPARLTRRSYAIASIISSRPHAMPRASPRNC